MNFMIFVVVEKMIKEYMTKKKQPGTSKQEIIDVTKKRINREKYLYLPPKKTISIQEIYEKVIELLHNVFPG